MLASLLSKRFLILTGLAGSGKTRLAQAFARWITPRQRSQYVLLPVGADWTSNDNIVGYPNGLISDAYVTTPALELIKAATENPRSPYFLVLDEMNLSHVERYFADLLSAIESGEEIPLYKAGWDKKGEKVIRSGVPEAIELPENLFIIGTVNVDETTYMFSPKVLDRANVIEFRLDSADVDAFLANPQATDLGRLDARGVGFGEQFVLSASKQDVELTTSDAQKFRQEMSLFFDLLRSHDAEFGYRVIYESARFLHHYKELGSYRTDSWFNPAFDAVIVQKLLPKLHGSRAKLERLLWALAWACGLERKGRDGIDFVGQLANAGQAFDELNHGPERILALIASEAPTTGAIYPLSHDKVMRMWQRLIRDQFVTFAEA